MASLSEKRLEAAFEDTEDPVHSAQQMALFNGYFKIAVSLPTARSGGTSAFTGASIALRRRKIAALPW